MSTSGTSTLSASSSVNSLVAQYMAIERRPLNDLNTRKSELNVRLGLYDDLKTKLSSVESLADDLADTTSSSVFNAKTASSDDADVITASAGSSAAYGLYQFRVKQLATATTMKSTAELNTAYSTMSTAQVIDGSDTLDTSDSFADAGFDTTPDGTVTVNGETFTLADYDTVDDFMTAINDDATAAANIYYDETRDRFFIESDTASDLVLSETGTNGFLTEVNVAAGTYNTNDSGVEGGAFLYQANFDTALSSSDSGSFKINGETITWDAETDTLNSVLSRINSSDAGVTAFYDDTIDRVVLSSDNPGSDLIALEDITGTFLTGTLNLNVGTQTQGLDAKFTINSTDSADEITRSSNTFDINGTTYTLVSTNVTAYTETTYTAVNVEQDVSTFQAKIKSFLSAFNNATSYLKTKTSADPDTYIRGALAGNSVYRSMRRNLLNIMMSSVDGLDEDKPSYLYEIGITFDDDLQISLSDVSALTEELADDPQAVEDLFNSTYGVAAQLESLLEPFVESYGIIDDTKDIINDQVEDIEDRIDRMEEHLVRKEQQFRDQFASMQQALYLVLQQQSMLQQFQSFYNNFMQQS